MELWVRAAALPGLAALSLTLGHRLEHLPSLCIWKRLTGVDCFGCGMGRALLAACRGDVAGALGYHRLVFVALVCVAWSSWNAVSELRLED